MTLAKDQQAAAGSGDAPAPSRGYQRRHQQADARIKAITASTPPHAPIDHAHLARYTLADAALEIEILTLFCNQAAQTLAAMLAAATACPADPNAWRRACHTLKGSARAVGATAVAALSEAAEQETDLSAGNVQRHIREVGSAVDVVTAYVGGLRHPV